MTITISLELAPRVWQHRFNSRSSNWKLEFTVGRRCLVLHILCAMSFALLVHPQTSQPIADSAPTAIPGVPIRLKTGPFPVLTTFKLHVQQSSRFWISLEFPEAVPPMMELGDVQIGGAFVDSYRSEACFTQSKFIHCVIELDQSHFSDVPLAEYDIKVFARFPATINWKQYLEANNSAIISVALDPIQTPASVRSVREWLCAFPSYCGPRWESKAIIVDVIQPKGLDTSGDASQTSAAFWEGLRSLTEKEPKLRKSRSESFRRSKRLDYLVVIDPPSGVDPNDFEEAYLSKYNSQFWDDVIGKLASALSISKMQIGLFLTDHPDCLCSKCFIFETDHASALGSTGGCAGFRDFVASIDLGSYTPANHATRPPTATVPGLASWIPKFMVDLLPKDARLEYLEMSDDYAEVIIRNLKGYVVVGGSEWEKLHVSFVLVRKASRPDRHASLRVIADGLTTPGIGKCPPDSQFTYDIELTHSQGLTEFVQHTATAAVSYLEAKR